MKEYETVRFLSKRISEVRLQHNKHDQASDAMHIRYHAQRKHIISSVRPPPNSQFNSIDTNNLLLLFLLLVIIIKTHGPNRPFTNCIRSPSSSPHRYGPTFIGVVPNTNLPV